MKIPTTIVKVVEASRTLIRRRLELKRSILDEASERVLNERRRSMHQALDALEKAVGSFEQDLTTNRGKKVARPFDWAGMFKAGEALLDLFQKVQRGDPRSVQSAQRFVRQYSRPDVIDGEIIE